MKIKAIITLSLFTIIIFAAPLMGQEWVESSNGLENPSMEGGRTELEFADINLDGNIDLVSIGDHGSPYINTPEHGIMVWFGDGQGNWSVHQSGNFGYGGIAVGDVNNDGYPDVGYGMHHNYSGEDFGDQLIEVALGNGTGLNWMPYDDGLATAGEDWGMFGTDFGDIDLDGDLDLVSASFGGGNAFQVYRNNGDGTWTHIYGYLGGNSNEYVEFGDLNRDGYLDIAATTSDSAIFIGDGTGNFTAVIGGGITPPGNYGYNDIALGDIDNDGADELAIVNLSSGTVGVWKLNQNGQTWTNLTHGIDVYTDVQMVDIADMNGDGNLDIVIYGNGMVGIFAGDGGNSWTLISGFTTPDPGNAEAFRAGADFDHNGFGDIAIVNEEGGFWNSRNHCRAYKEISIPQSLSIIPEYPHGNEVLRGGAAGWIEWLSAVLPNGDTSSVDIEFSASGPDGPYQTIASNLPNNGKYQLIWPNGINSTDCYFRLTVHQGLDEVSAITPHPFELISSFTATVSIEMIPDNPPVVVSPGGSFTYTGILTNNTDSAQTVDVWVMIDVTDSFLFGPVKYYPDITLTPNETITIYGITQYVPTYAPIGDYIYIAYCGDYPDNPIDLTSFEFTVEPPICSNTEDNGWLLKGWFDDTANNTQLPSETELLTNYPNPFNATTTINYMLSESDNVKLEIYNLQGKKVATIFDGYQSAGYKSVRWNGSNFSSGVYFYRLSTSTYSRTRRMTLLK